jgi:hypothetical protein
MIRVIRSFALIAAVMFTSCAKKESAEAPNPNAEPAKPAAEVPATPPVGGPHAFVHLKNGNKVPGTIVASTKTEMVVLGDDGIESKIPMSQVKSVEYGDKPSAPPAQTAKTNPPAPRPAVPGEKPTPEKPATLDPAPPPGEERTAATKEPTRVTPQPPAVTTKTYMLPAGSEVSVRVDETIDSGTALEGQTFSAQVTRNAVDANGDVVIPRGSRGEVVIRSASKGGRFKGTSDLVLDLQSVTIHGKEYRLETTGMTKEGKSGLGANKRTAIHTGGGAALGAIIGAIAGGGKGAAIGAGAGAGAGALTQILTKGRAIKVPAESVLTFNLDQPLKVTSAQ